MTERRLVEVDITGRDDGELVAWDAGSGAHIYVAGGAGSVATDAIWDDAGDLAVGSGANTAAKLPIGAAGGALSRINGAVAWNSGTVFPTAAAGDRFWRTDLGMEFYYDGTRWLSTQLLTCEYHPGTSDYSTAGAVIVGGVGFDEAGLDVYLVDMQAMLAVISGTHDASNQYHLEAWKFDANGSGGAGTELGQLETHTVAAGLNNSTGTVLSLNAVIDVSATPAIGFILREIGNTGVLRVYAQLRYRFIAT